MATSWIHEPESGRYYVNWDDGYGRIIRRYSDEVDDGSASASQLPSARQQYETPRSESSNRSYTASSKQSTKHRSRRDSESFSRRPEPISEYPTTQPITIRNESLKKYHDPGGYDQAGEETYDRSNYDSPSSQRQYDNIASNTSGSYHQPTHRQYDNIASSTSGSYHQPTHRQYDNIASNTSGSYHQPTHRDWAQDPTVESLTRRTNTLTINDVVGSSEYQVASTPQSFPARGYDDSRGQVQLPSMTDTGPTGYSASQEVKGKGRDQSTYEAPRTQEKRHIYGTRGDTEELDHSYKVRNHDYEKFFKPGRVFSTLWTDAYAGTTNVTESENNQFMSHVTCVIYKQRVYSKIRRFVVVRLGNRSCQCLPVTTYDGRGPTKKGINLDEHGLIYSSDRRPSRIEGITKAALKVKLSKGAEKLINPSLINYGRVYCVETNVKVKDVGDLDSDSKKLLRRYYNEVNIVPDDEIDAVGPPQDPREKANEFANMGGVVAGNQQGYSVAQSSGFAPLAVTTTSTSMQADYNQPRGYDRSSGGYNQPSGGWANAGTFAPAGQTLYAPVPNYNPQTGATHHTVTPAIRYAINPVYDMSRNPSSGGYQQTDNRYIQTTAGTTGGALPASSYSGNAAPLYESTQDTRTSHIQVSATTWSEDAPGDHDSYSRQDDYPSGRGQSSSTRIISSNPLYFPAESSGSTEPFDTQSHWSTQVQTPYNDDDDDLELTGREEAQATRRHRRDSVSTKSGGRSGDSQRESDRHQRDRRRK